MKFNPKSVSLGLKGEDQMAMMSSLMPGWDMRQDKGECLCVCENNEGLCVCEDLEERDKAMRGYGRKSNGGKVRNNSRGLKI